MPITLPDETRGRLTEAVKAHVRDEWDVEIGDLRAGLFVGFLVETLGPALYNQGVRDAQAHLGRIVDDLDVTIHEVEP